ncbi:MAG: TolB family protein [Vicinamibacterales bacterium]
MTRIHRSTASALLACALAAAPRPAAAQSMLGDGYVLPPAGVQELFRRDKNYATLDRLSPDGDHFLVPTFQELTDLSLMSQRTLRLAMLELVPEVNREWRLATYGNEGLSLFSLKERRTYPVQTPEGAFVSDMRWSPDGSQLAFVAHPRGTASQVWIADVKTGQSRRVSEAAVMATLVARPGGGGEAAETAGGRLLQWLPDGSLLTVIVPSNRGPEPQEPAVPVSPIIRRSRDTATPTSTQPFLLRTATDERRFKYYTTAQLAILAPGRAPRPIGQPMMYLDYTLSPDGRAILRETIDEPLSYLVPFSSFGRRLEVIDLDGTVLSEIRRRPLQEAQSRGRDANDTLPRDVAWRPDGKGLSFLWRENGGTDAPKDRVMLLAPPYALAQAQTLVSSEQRLSDVRYSRDGRYATVTAARRPANGGGAREDLVAYDLTASPPAAFVLKAGIDASDPLQAPGEPMTTASGNGVVALTVSGDGAAVFLRGEGYRPTFAPQPFVDRVTIRTGASTRLFEGAAGSFDQPLVALDADARRLIVSREGRGTVPDSYLWTAATNTFDNLTANRDPYPEITAARRVDFEFTRQDGVKVRGRISLPVNYQPGTRVPAVIRDYTRE